MKKLKNDEFGSFDYIANRVLNYIHRNEIFKSENYDLLPKAMIKKMIIKTTDSTYYEINGKNIDTVIDGLVNLNLITIEKRKIKLTENTELSKILISQECYTS